MPGSGNTTAPDAGSGARPVPPPIQTRRVAPEPSTPGTVASRSDSETVTYPSVTAPGAPRDAGSGSRSMLPAAFMPSNARDTTSTKGSPLTRFLGRSTENLSFRRSRSRELVDPGPAPNDIDDLERNIAFFGVQQKGLPPPSPDAQRGLAVQRHMGLPPPTLDDMLAAGLADDESPTTATNAVDKSEPNYFLSLAKELREFLFYPMVSANMVRTGKVDPEADDDLVKHAAKVAGGDSALARSSSVTTFDSLVERTELPKVLYQPGTRRAMAESRQHRPYFTMVVTALQVATLIAGFILNWKWTGSVIETNPFNYLIGPSSGVLIAMGARFLPCIRGHSVFETSLVACTEGLMPVANPSFVGSVQVCSLADYCAPYSGGGNQWYRFFMAMFLHGGVLHFIMNMAFQLRSGWALEREYGWWRYGAIYLTSGIGGFIFGGLFAGDMSVSVGCSGALYGLNACLVLDLIQNWGLIRRPKLELFKMTLSVIFSFVLGTLPYIDNMAHLGGFFTGIFSSLIFAPTMHFSKWDRRRKRFMTVISMPILVVIMFFMFYDFYRNTNRCPWCKYINCIPGMPWCDQKW